MPNSAKATAFKSSAMSFCATAATAPSLRTCFGGAGLGVKVYVGGLQVELGFRPQSLSPKLSASTLNPQPYTSPNSALFGGPPTLNPKP